MAIKMIENPLSTVSFDVLDCRLKGIYNLMRKDNISKAVSVINQTIWSINHAKSSECPRQFINFFVEQLYSILIDIAFKRIPDAHNRIRDLHYTIMDILTPVYDDAEIVAMPLMMDMTVV